MMMLGGFNNALVAGLLCVEDQVMMIWVSLSGCVCNCLHNMWYTFDAILCMLCWLGDDTTMAIWLCVDYCVDDAAAGMMLVCLWYVYV